MLDVLQYYCAQTNLQALSLNKIPHSKEVEQMWEIFGIWGGERLGNIGKKKSVQKWAKMHEKWLKFAKICKKAKNLKKIKKKYWQRACFER